MTTASGQDRPAGGPSDGSSSPEPSRLTIGFLTHYIDRDSISFALWRGMIDQADEEDVNLICFPGNAPQATHEFDAMANVIYAMANRRNIDGLLVWGSGMEAQSTAEHVKAMLASFHELPIVNIGQAIEGIPAILIDNYQGMYWECEHLIEKHGCRRIAFLRGPLDHQESNVRFAAYKDALRAHGLAYDPRFVILGDLTRDFARQALSSFLDRCPDIPDAVVAVNDLSAIGVMDELGARQLAVPDLIKVMGFDDLEQSQYLKIPLATVRQPFYEMGRMAVKSLIALTRGEKVHPVTSVPSRLITRQSCGCFNPLMTQAPLQWPTETTGKATGAELVDRLTADVARVLDPLYAVGKPRSRTIGNVLTAALAELDEERGSFIATFARELTSANAQADIDFFHSLLSETRRAVLPFVVGDAARLLAAEDLWHQARMLISHYAQRQAILLGYQNVTQNDIIQNVNRIMVTSFDLDLFIASLAQALLRLEFRCCFLALYEDRRSFAVSRLLLALSDGERVNLDRMESRFPTIELVPSGLLSRSRRFKLVVQPLYFGKNQLGFILLEEGPQIGIVNEILRAQLSAAVQGALLYQERGKLLADIEERARQLQRSGEELARANADLEQFAVIASHDLKEPLRKISLFAGRLKEEGASLPVGQRNEYLDRMQAACLHLNKLIQNLLTYSRLSSRVPHFRRIELADPVAEALFDLKSAVEDSNASIEVGALPALEAEGDHLRLLFFHLIDNALKFRSPERAPTVTISGREIDRDGRRYVEVSVSDRGIGIEPKYHDKIFEVFQRLHSARDYEGTGMGLAMCKKIVERHNGTISVESGDGGGTRFVVTLPAAAG